MDKLKALLAEAAENTMVAGSCMFLFIAFFAAIPEPKAALLPLALAAGCYGIARLKDPD
ncbi:MAG: hypothetical protein AB8B79_22740 [Granulosicoccus sp.]